MIADIIVDIAAWIIAVGTILAIYNTYKWWNWQDKLGGKALRYLYRSALTKTVAAIPLAVIAVYRLTGGHEAPPFPLGGPIVGISVSILLLNLTITTWAFRELDEAIKTGASIEEYNTTERSVED